jgi:hypothetical protein
MLLVLTSVENSAAQLTARVGLGQAVKALA